LTPVTAPAAAPPPVVPLSEPPRVATPPSVRAPAPTAIDQLRFEQSGRLVVDDLMPPASREQYRHLAASLHKTQQTNGCKVVMIASAAVGEGKTLTAANLALTLTESYHRQVLLIDADLRRPSLHVLFGLSNASGLSDGLSSQGRTFPVQQLSARLSILTSGKLGADPMAELTSDAMKRLVQLARDTHDWVVIDTPPIGVLPDAGLVAAMADAAILVVRAESTPHNAVARAADALGRQKIVGVVLNRAKKQAQSGAYRYYSGAPGSSPTAGR
jgi:capsular exopolysaccharide synthesis family protein